MTGPPPRRSLLHRRDFVLLWSGQSVSELGSQGSVLALPLLAIDVLHATTFQVGLLTAVETLPFLLVGLPAGAWVDRMRRRPVMMRLTWVGRWWWRVCRRPGDSASSPSASCTPSPW